MIGATMALVRRWFSAAQAARISGKATVMNDDWVVAYRSTPAGSPDAGRVACVFISSDGMAMTLSDGSKRHEVEAITDTAAGRLEAALRVRDWLGGPHLSADDVRREVAERRGVALEDHRGWSCEWE